MSTFTISVAELVAHGFDFGLGPNDYPIYDEAVRDDLNRKIIDHYMNYEIGQETESMFKFALNRRMREIMPYYNELYKTTKIHYDPLVTVDFTDAAVSESEGTSTSTVNTESTSNASNTNENETRSQARAVNMELPQVRLSGDEDYATSSADTVGDSTASATGTATTADTGESTGSGSETANGTVTHTVNGRQGSAAALVMEFRAALLNIDMLVIAELNNLFMGVWDNGDEFAATSRNYYGATYFPI